MHVKSAIVLLFAAEGLAFPFVPTVPGVESSLLGLGKRQQSKPNGPGSLKQCPVNPNHKGAVPYNPKYPYNYAKNGLPGKGQGGFLVPAKGDTAHRFIAPDYSKDVRGPCPGLNAMANHGFLSRDGITTFTELVDAQQNVYNVGYDLANLLAVLGLTTTDGDVVTEKLSIGCDATPRTAPVYVPGVTGHEPGLDGHNKFEADSSLTRKDYFLNDGNNFDTYGSLFGQMTRSTGGLFNFEGMAKYRHERYLESRKENPNFYFGPFSLLLYGASSFLYELMPSGTRDYKPDLYTISHFFGVKKTSDGTWKFAGDERIPDNWTNRVDPYDNFKVGDQIIQQYAAYPVLFGGNTGKDDFDALQGANGIENGKLNATDSANVMCLIYMLATERTPSSLNTFVTPAADAISFALSKLNPAYQNLGCPQPLT